MRKEIALFAVLLASCEPDPDPTVCQMTARCIFETPFEDWSDECDFEGRIIEIGGVNWSCSGDYSGCEEALSVVRSEILVCLLEEGSL